MSCTRTQRSRRPVSLKPTDPRFRFKHSTCTTEPLRFLYYMYQIKMYISVHSDCFILANSVDPGEMPYNAAYNLGRHSLSNSTPLCVSRINIISLYTALEGFMTLWYIPHIEKKHSLIVISQLSIRSYGPMFLVCVCIDIHTSYVRAVNSQMGLHLSQALLSIY